MIQDSCLYMQAGVTTRQISAENPTGAKGGGCRAAPNPTFSSPYLGMPLAKFDNPGGPRKYGLYRWHILDSIGFAEDIRVTVQSLAWYPNGVEPGLYRPAPADIASVAYWYQTEPHQDFPALPVAADRCDLKTR